MIITMFVKNTMMLVHYHRQLSINHRHRSYLVFELRVVNFKPEIDYSQFDIEYNNEEWCKEER